MVGKRQLGDGRAWERAGRGMGWGGGEELDLVLHRMEAGVDGKLDRPEVAAGKEGLGMWGRQGGSLLRQGSRDWGRLAQSTGLTFASALLQALK